MTKKVLIIIPTRNESAHNADKFKFIFAQDYPINLTEVVVDGHSDDNARNVVDDKLNNWLNERLISKPIASALNYAIKASSGEILIRSESRSINPSNYTSLFVCKIESLITQKKIEIFENPNCSSNVKILVSI